MKRLLLSLILPCFLFSSALAQAAGVGSGQGQFTIQTQHSLATIEAIDLTAMKAKLKLDDGKTVEVNLDPKVKNLDKVHVGDTLDIKKTFALLLYPRKGDEKADSYNLRDVQYDTTPHGKPVKYIVETRVINAVIKDFDKARHLVTLEEADGKTTEYKLNAPVQGFAKAKKGDGVYARFTESVVVMVHPAKAAK